MEVWVVHSGCRYEGGSIDAILDSEQKAIWYVKNSINKCNNRERHRFNPRRSFWRKFDRQIIYNNQGDLCYQVNRPSEWKRSKIDPKLWEKASDYMSIQLWKVL